MPSGNFIWKPCPWGRVATDDDCAEAIFGLVLSPFVTGENLIVDGGI